jgi:SAM-dependent methyltransferase
MEQKASEISRIQSVYTERDAAGRRGLYAWHRPEVRQQEGEKKTVVASLLAGTIGTDLCGIHVLDVGCGTGGFLRTLVEWGAQPSNLLGTEFLQNRLDIACRCSPPDIKWHLGGLEVAASGSFDLVVTNTVFSSILDDHDRLALATEMWRVLKPGGWVMVFDFRYNNPSNPNVRKVTRKELRGYWPGAIREEYRTLLLAPPIARRVIPSSRLAGETLASFFPFLRSHFYFMAQKP